MQPTTNLNMFQKKRLSAARDFFQSEGKYCVVDDIYFDFGQDWMWTTLVVGRTSGSSYQIYPRDWEDIIEGDINKFTDAIKRIMEQLEGV